MKSRRQWENEIIGTLAELQEQLDTATNLLDPDLSSEEYTEIAEVLEETRNKLEAADDLNDQAASQLAEDQVAEAAETEDQAADATEEAVAQATDTDLPESVSEAVEDANEAAEDAAEAAQDAKDAAAEDKGEEAQSDAEEAVSEAGEEIKEAIGRTKEAEEEARRMLAAKLGELNRAVDERAAAEARDNAEQLAGEDTPSDEANMPSRMTSKQPLSWPNRMHKV